MQMIWNDLSEGNITVSTEDASFPLENMSNNNPSSVWKATSTSATITVTLTSAGEYAWALYSTSDNAIQYRVKNGGSTIASGSIDSDLFSNFWLDDLDVGPSTGIEFDVSGAIASSVGILRGGQYIASDDAIDLSREFKDFSEMRLTRNQAYDFYQKNRVWMFSGTTQALLAGTGATLTPGMSEYLYFYKTLAPYPVALKVLETNFKHYTFGIPTFRDSGQVIYKSTNKFISTSFSIEEVV